MTDRQPPAFDPVALGRIEERTSQLLGQMAEMKVMLQKTATVDQLRELKAETVSRAEFEPIRKFVFGAIALFLTGIGAAIVALVIGK